MVSMSNLYTTEPDFEAEITILTAEQGGRSVPPRNYIRWDFGYAEDSLLGFRCNHSMNIYGIHPNFLDDNGKPNPQDIPLVGTFLVRMHIVVKDMVEYHRKRLSVGTKVNCHGGARIVAKGTVTRLRACSP